MIKNIDAETFSKMFISGANNLSNNKNKVNSLNVFPVPDGDTGTNMSMTASAVAGALDGCRFADVSSCADVAANAALRGARGNSGVIMSQFIRGMAKTLKGLDVCGPRIFADGLKAGSDAAYRAVMNPTEGTVLTVAREAAAGAVLCESDDLCGVMRACVDRGNRALKKTEFMLDTLKKAGVVDAGGQGWMYILEGMLYYIENGEVIQPDESEQSVIAALPKETDNKNESSENIKFGYCTEFIIEKRNSRSLLIFKNSIEKLGDCMLVIEDDEVIKVHIHTNHPGTVIENALKLGEIINIKIDNMRYQHSSIISAEKDSGNIKKYGFAAVSSGKGFSDILKDLGVDAVIEGGQTMNPSSEDILKAAESINAECIFVFPNNKNIIMAAEQAAEMSEKNIIVIPTRSVPESIRAMTAFDAELNEKENAEIFRSEISRVKTACVTYAVRDLPEDNIKEGDIIGILGSDIAVSGNDRWQIAAELIKKMTESDTEFVTVYCQEENDMEKAEETAALLEEEFEDVEFSVKYGAQPVYYYIISAEQ